MRVFSRRVQIHAPCATVRDVAGRKQNGMEEGKELFKTGGLAKVARPSSIRGVKERLLADYRQDHKGILERLERTAAGYNTDQLLTLIVEDMLYSSEDLQATLLMLENEGSLKDNASLTITRANLLRLVADIVAKKKELAQKSGEVDLNAPAFMLFQKLCFERLTEAMESLKLDQETRGLLLSDWGARMKDWDKDLRRMLKELDE